ncbi:cell division protein ZipA [Gammaproteobacteria bacterium]|nr:cell division protein ZipA [Gammaproteobacteria bacterium]
MIERDTIVLVLGLLIVGVFVRGLIVAIRARKNQLRFALEKNVPDIENSDEKNFAELPQGGARVVAKKELDKVPKDKKAGGLLFSTVTDDHDFFKDSEDQPVPNSDFNEHKYENKYGDGDGDGDGDGCVMPVEGLDASEATKEEFGSADFLEDKELGLGFDFETPSEISKSIESNSMNLTEDIDGQISVSIEDRIGFTQPPDRASKIPIAAIEFAEQGKSFFSRLRKQKTDDPDLSLNDPLFSEYTNDDEYIAANGAATEDTQEFNSSSAGKLASSPSEDASDIREKSISEQPLEILIVNVMAKEGRLIRGEELLNFFETQALHYGEMGIFHKYVDDDFKGSSIFRVVNMLNPGTFDLKEMNEFTTFGVSFFLSLPSCMNNFDAFEYMLLVAKNLQESLGAELRDDQRNAMTEQTIEHYRQRVRDFELASLRTRGNNE